MGCESIKFLVLRRCLFFIDSGLADQDTHPMFDVIERLKSEWTDKHVVINSPAPELARFTRATGLVKTVNMNGHCLVEFDQYNNTGWYDIEPSFLKVVPKPLPKPAEAKPAAKEASKPVAKAAAPKAQPVAAAKPVAAGVKRPSTADILAAARAKTAAAAPASQAPVDEAPAAVEELTAAAAIEAVLPAAVATQKPRGTLPKTTTEIIAWCRSKDAAS